jgi:pSer/pThr/pTyr-binding forkhead associated (FHA) protein
MYRLLFQNHVAPKEPVVVDLPSVTIGRDAACQVRLSENGVADRHARIERRANGYYLSDLGSPNGVFVNGQRVTGIRLVSDDELEIGGARMRFEIVHGVFSGQQRRPLDLLQLAAATVVVLVIGGQVALLSSIFSESRPKKMKIDTGHGWRGQQAMVGSAESPAAPVTPTVSEPRSPAGAVAVSPNAPAPRAATPAVLNRMIRIVRVDRGEAGGIATLTIQAKAQVGERELDTSAVAICVQFAVPGGTAQNVAWRDPVWLPISAWENFKNKVFTVRFPGAAREMAGFVVRTYYRNQLQDVAVAPPSLQSIAPTPIPGGAS